MKFNKKDKDGEFFFIFQEALIKSAGFVVFFISQIAFISNYDALNPADLCYVAVSSQISNR